MKMSKSDTTQLWHAVIDNDYPSFAKINNRLLNAPTALKHVPIRIFLPSVQNAEDSSSAPAEAMGSFKIIQSLIQPAQGDRRPTLLGQALREMMPVLFPSSRDPVLATVVMHGAQLPFNTPLQELMKDAAYPDGWICLVVKVL